MLSCRKEGFRDKCETVQLLGECADLKADVRNSHLVSHSDLHATEAKKEHHMLANVAAVVYFNIVNYALASVLW